MVKKKRLKEKSKRKSVTVGKKEKAKRKSVTAGKKKKAKRKSVTAGKKKKAKRESVTTTKKKKAKKRSVTVKKPEEKKEDLPSLSDLLNDTNKVKSRIKRQLAKEWDADQKKATINRSLEESIDQKQINEVARFGDFEVSISGRNEEQLVEVNKKK